jgi:uncharacterized protein with HEPN domain
VTRSSAAERLSLQRKPHVFLWHAREAADAIISFTRGKTEQDFTSDLLLRSAVERQFLIIGEALGHLSKHAPDLASQIPDLARVVAFRNVLVHGYAVVDNAIVWRIVKDDLPKLRAAVDGLINATGAADT